MHPCALHDHAHHPRGRRFFRRKQSAYQDISIKDDKQQNPRLRLQQRIQGLRRQTITGSFGGSVIAEIHDDFGFSDTKTVTVYVGSTAPTENDDSSLPDWNGRWDDIFSQFGNMS